MKSAATKIHPRSPRYILSTEDLNLIRVAGPHQIPWEEGTQIKDISLTGLSFTAPSDLCPTMGEFIKIQFSIPNGKQMACHALVTRIDDLKTNEKLIGVHFYKLEMPHRIALAQGLQKKFKAHPDRIKNEFQHQSDENLLNNMPSLFVMGINLGLWVFMTVFLMTEPIPESFILFINSLK